MWTLSKLAKKNLHEPPQNSSCGLEMINLIYLESANLDPLLKQMPIGLTENHYERSFEEIFNV